MEGRVDMSKRSGFVWVIERLGEDVINGVLKVPEVRLSVEQLDFFGFPATILVLYKFYVEYPDWILWG